MKMYKRIYICSILLFALVWGIVFVRYHSCKKNQGDNYVIEMNRAVEQFEECLHEGKLSPQEILQVNEKQYKNAVFISKEQQDENKIPMVKGETNVYLWSIYDNDGEFTGMLKFTREITPETDVTNWLYFGIACSFLLMQLVMFLIYQLYIKPMHQLEEYPEKISKGNSLEHLPETKYRNLGKFIWGINMLSDTLASRQDDLNKAQASKQSMLSGIAHGVKTPVANIKLYAEAIKTGLYQPDFKPNESDCEIADKIQCNADDIENLVTKLLHTASSGNYVYTPKICPFYMKALADRMERDFENRMKVKSIPFIIQRTENPLIPSDEDGVYSILCQFMENAMKYGDGTGIRLVLEKQEENVYLSVINKGEILPDSELSYVFNSFWRGSNATGRPGSGMGMYTAKEMAKQLQGEVYVRALKESGEMEFTLVL